MAVKLLLPVLLLLLPFLSLSTAQKDLSTLLTIKSSWPSSPALVSWTSTTAHCNWTGITCSDTGSVTSITLSYANLTNPIPSAVCELQNLTYLDLSYNSLPGSFPTFLYNCSSLTHLDLSDNFFVGTIPSDIHRLSPKLSYLALAANNFTGDIPESITRLSSLQTLYLDNNLFNVAYPAEISHLTSLQQMSLANNPFVPARIPPEFGNLTSLTYLWMAEMNIVGPIPETLSGLSQLVWLDLSMNNITGGIPRWIWTLENLQNLYLYKNQLTGEISSTIGALQLVEIDLAINQLTGRIPEGFGKLKNLQQLHLYYNHLSGSIPTSIGLLTELTDIRIFNNKLTGVLPPELGKHSRLRDFEIDDNQLSGELPQFLCAGQELTSFAVFDNNFTGALPATLGDCPTLDYIQINNNRFIGDVPAGIWSAVNLTTVILNNNALTGTLPNQMPHNLSILNVGSNRFTGSIPSTAGNLVKFMAADNQFSGDVQAGFSDMPLLQTLSLAGNQITGSIPSDISSLRFLTNLNLSSNAFSGEIPAAIGDLPVLTSLDLSNNQLSGVIPQEIGNLRLNNLNVSSNQLTGEIPTSLQNPVFDQSFLSNPGLCSGDCATPSHHSSKFAVELRVLILVLGAALLSIGVVFVLLTIRTYHRRSRSDGPETWKLTSFHTGDFVESNIVRGLTDQNEIGSGGSGKVYRVALPGGTVVAVKKIWNSRKLDSKLEKQFQAEVQILGSIRHINIVKLLCCVSSADSKLLVYEYMGNGSLDQWLHKRRQEGEKQYATLDWKTRAVIAVGAAKGLCYMHHHCSPPIVHRDVKSSNILLDSAFGAKIADFGLSRMLVKAGEADSVSGIAGSFGYMAPECGYQRKVNEKMDVYSFGVVLLELVTGKEANDERDEECLAEWTWQRLQDGVRVTDIIDEDIRDSIYMDEIELVLRLGLICTGALPSGRPSMEEVLHVLLRCDPSTAGDGYNKLYGKCFDVVPLLQPKKGSRRKPLDADEGYGYGYDLEKGTG